MKKYAIVVDSSAALSPQQINDLNVYVAPLSIIYNGQNYVDQVTMTREDVVNALAQHHVLQTSQPNIGTIIGILENLKEDNYDHIFVIALSSSLSGTFSAFNQAVQEVVLDNVTVVDSYSLAGPVQQIIHYIRNAEKNDLPVAEIMTHINRVVDNTSSYVYPQDLKQLKASGRISSSAATLASLLKIKPLLRLENKGATIEKFATARTEAKIMDTLIADINLHNINALDHVLYVLEFEAKDTADRFENFLSQTYPGIEIHRVALPAAVATHAGLGTIAVQWTVKI